MVFGNFGFEPPLDGHEPPPIVGAWVDDLRRRFSGERGIDVEDKGYSVAVHYRRAADPHRARRLIEDTVRSIRGGRVLEGTLAVMLIPKSGPSKGSTLQAIRRRLKCDRAIYIGDDGTDEDAFASAPAESLLSIRVGGGPTCASFRIERQADVDRLLSRMLALTAGPRGQSAAPDVRHSGRA
jgi:trehalose 6-phosphate phosphatase